MQIKQTLTRAFCYSDKKLYKIRFKANNRINRFKSIKFIKIDLHKILNLGEHKLWQN